MTQDFQQDDSGEFAEAVKHQIAAFNALHWDAGNRRPLGLKHLGPNGELLAGLAGRTFGHWLLIDNFWVDERLRGQGVGSSMLARAEAIARERGCTLCLLDTLNFQARPFYEKRGYRVEWTQENYPVSGCKYFMVKTL